MTVAEFLGTYAPKPPARPPANADELRKLSDADGLRQLGPAPADNALWSRPSKKGDPGCHLWVIDESGIPYILETAGVVPSLASGVVKHTNLTGGGLAACAGELWFEAPRAVRLYVNGCSGRYGPTSASQLEDAVRVFEGLGYEVVSFGWDEGAHKPHVVLR